MLLIQLHRERTIGSLCLTSPGSHWFCSLSFGCNERSLWVRQFFWVPWALLQFTEPEHGLGDPSTQNYSGKYTWMENVRLWLITSLLNTGASIASHSLIRVWRFLSPCVKLVKVSVRPFIMIEKNINVTIGSPSFYRTWICPSWVTQKTCPLDSWKARIHNSSWTICWLWDLEQTL